MVKRCSALGTDLDKFELLFLRSTDIYQLDSGAYVTRYTESRTLVKEPQCKTCI